VVLSSCADDAANGTSEVTDLGPDNSGGATSATAAFTFTYPDVYKVSTKW